MYLPVSVNLSDDGKELQLLKDSLINNKYYYVIEKLAVHVEPSLKKIDDYHAGQTLSRFERCDLVLLGKNRGQDMPPYFGVNISEHEARLSEYVSYLYDTTSIINDISMLIEYLSVKNKNIKYLIVPNSLGFFSYDYKLIHKDKSTLVEVP